MRDGIHTVLPGQLDGSLQQRLRQLRPQRLIDLNRLTHFKCPTSVVFTEVLPKGGSGKLLKAELRKRFGSGAAAGA